MDWAVGNAKGGIGLKRVVPPSVYYFSRDREWRKTEAEEKRKESLSLRTKPFQHWIMISPATSEAATTTFPNRTQSHKIWAMKKRKELGHGSPSISPPPKSRRLVSTNCLSSLLRITHCLVFTNTCWTETWRSWSATWWWRKRKM